MVLVDLVVGFIKQLNGTIKNVGAKSAESLEQLKKRIDRLVEKTSASESRALHYLDKMNIQAPSDEDTVYIRKDGALRAVVSMSPVKPVISPVNKLREVCDCSFPGFPIFNQLQGFVNIDSEEELIRMDQGLTAVCMEVFSHNYRSFEDICCLLAISTPEGFLYIVDAIKYRAVLPKLSLFRCGVLKMMHCECCVDNLFRNFGSIGCYRNFAAPPSDVFVDWRIRPVNEVLTSIITSSMQCTLEKLSTGISPMHHIPEVQSEYDAFKEKYNLPESMPVLEDLIKLRSYLGRRYNEGIQYVLPDQHLLTLWEARPANVDALEELFPKMSSVLRLHATDFVITLNQRGKGFSLDKLKEKAEAEEDISEVCSDGHVFATPKEKYKPFGESQTTSLEDFDPLSMSSDK